MNVRTLSDKKSRGADNTHPDYLVVNNIEVIYNHVILVLKGVSLHVQKGGITTLLGGNGAGKTTTLKTISNLLRSERGEVTKGEVEFKGRSISHLTPADLVRIGIIQVMEGRHCFEHLTVEENLLTGAYTRFNLKTEIARNLKLTGLKNLLTGADTRTSTKTEIARDLERVYHYFPRLKERRKSQAGYISGGEQQMCAIGRALMAQPEMILLDEPSMGLAPQLVEEIFIIVKNLNEQEQTTFLLAEQNTNVALRFAQYGYILESGRVVMDGTADELRANEDVKEFYLGVSGEGRRSFREGRSYRRRKRWLN